MAEIDKNMPLVALTQIAEILNAKIRTLRTYEEKGLLPKKEKTEKKLYSLNDIPLIELVHYLASVKKINANGIKTILKIYNTLLDEKQKKEILSEAENSIEKNRHLQNNIIDSF